MDFMLFTLFLIQQMVSFIVLSNFPDVVIGAFYFCGMQVLFQDRNTKKKLHIYCLGRVYLYIWFILEYHVIYLLPLCQHLLNFTILYVSL